MLSRTLGLATVMLLAGWFADPAAAQNLEAGKSPSQIFSGTCSACHKSPRGLLKTVAPGSLPGFLREHYTTSRDMAGTMAGYLTSNGASDPRGSGGLTKQGQEAKSGPRPPPDQAEPAPGRRPKPGQQEAARPDADGLSQPAPRRRRAPDTPAVEANAPADAGPAAGPGSRGKQKLGKRGRPPHEEPAKPDVTKETVKDQPKDEPKNDVVAPVEAAKPDVPKSDGVEPARDSAKVDTATPEHGKPEPFKPASGEIKPGTAAVTPHHDPVPQVTPAPKQDGPKPDVAKPDVAKPDVAKPDVGKPDAPAQQDAKAPEIKPSEPHAAPAMTGATPAAPASESPAPAPPASVATSPPPPAGPPMPPISQ